MWYIIQDGIVLSPQYLRELMYICAVYILDYVPYFHLSCVFNAWTFKEVLRRENQGLKVYKVDGSLVFSMTGTYF